jgi:hypothetical protein
MHVRMSGHYRASRNVRVNKFVVGLYGCSLRIVWQWQSLEKHGLPGSIQGLTRAIIEVKNAEIRTKIVPQVGAGCGSGLGFVVILLGLWLPVTSLMATVTVSTPANARVAADQLGRAYSALNGPALSEGATGDIGTGTIVLNAPPGFTFDPNAIVTATVTRIAGTGAALALSNATAAVTTSNITVIVTNTDGSGTRSQITWAGIGVRPTAGTPLASGNITRSGTATVTGISTSTSLGALTEIAGIAVQLSFATQPTNANVGTPFGTQPIVVTKDQFGNNSTNGLPATNNVTMLINSGSGSLQGNQVLNIGTAGGAGTASYAGLRLDAAGSKSLAAAADYGLATAYSLSFNVTSGPCIRLQVLLPGERPAPGTATGKMGTPNGEGSGVPFAIAVRAVDAFWNAVVTNDTVRLSSSDLAAALPANTALTNGTVVLTLTANTLGNQTLTASNVTHPVILSSTSSVFVVRAPGPVLGSPSNLTINEGVPLTITNAASQTNIVAAGPASNSTNTVIFTYTNRNALLADGWSFTATSPDGSPRETEITNRALGALLDYDQVAHPGEVRIPCDYGDLWAQINTSRNTLFRSLPPNWTSLRLAMKCPARMDVQQAHLALYQDDDNYVQAGMAYNSILGGELTSLVWEINGSPDHFITWVDLITNLSVRLDRTLGSAAVTAYYSLDGVTWLSLGTTNQGLINPQLCIWTGGSRVAWTNGLPTCDLQRLDIAVSNSPVTVLTYQLVAPPLGAYIDNQGVIHWTPGEDRGNTTNVFTTIVTDNGQPPISATNSFQVLVNEINSPPVLPALMDRVTLGQTPVVIANGATDPDFPSNPLAYQLLAAPAGAAIDTNGVISWIPALNQVPSTNVLITRVTDTNATAVNARQLSATNSVRVYVFANPVWNRPVLPIQATQSVYVAAALVVTNTATPGLVASQLSTNTLSFSYTNRDALLADGWSFTATQANGSPRKTEVTDPAQGAVVDYSQTNHPGVLRIPCDVGDLWGGLNSTRNSLFRSLPTNWFRVELALGFTPTTNGQQVHLTFYQDDDNYVQSGYAYNGVMRAALDREAAAAAVTLSAPPMPSGDLRLGLVRDLGAGSVDGLFSNDGGSTWLDLGTVYQTMANPQLCIWVGGSPAPFTNGMPVCDLQSLTVISSNAVPPILNYQLVSPPTGATINTNGVITWTPSTGQGPANYLITTVVSNNGVPPLSDTNVVPVVVSSSTVTVQSVIIRTNVATLTWSAVPGTTYWLQYKNQLTDPSWQDILPPVVASGPTATATNALGTASQRFYRIRY